MWIADRSGRTLLGSALFLPFSIRVPEGGRQEGGAAGVAGRVEYDLLFMVAV